MTAKVIKIKEREPSELQCAIDAAIEALSGELDVVCLMIHALEERRYETTREAAVRKAAHAFMENHGHRLIDIRDKLYAVERLA